MVRCELLRAAPGPTSFTSFQAIEAVNVLLRGCSQPCAAGWTNLQAVK